MSKYNTIIVHYYAAIRKIIQSFSLLEELFPESLHYLCELNKYNFYSEFVIITYYICGQCQKADSLPSEPH